MLDQFQTEIKGMCDKELVTPLGWFSLAFSTFLGLTEEFPTLTTFFHGEIISERYPFLTRKWEAHEEVDRKHWSKFPAFESFSKTFNSDNFDYSQLKNLDCMFMRWKEHFLVPDHTIKEINGASFAGFYYICFNKQNRTIEGYYFHKTSEM